MITLAQIDNAVQLSLRNITSSPLSQNTRVEAYNRVIDFLQSKAHWNCSKKRAYFNYLQDESEYSLTQLGITDFKGYKDLRFLNDNLARQYREFEELDDNQFSVLEGQSVINNYLNFEDREGSKIMRLLSLYQNGKSTIDSFGDLTTGRTWVSDTTNSDATTLAVDTTRTKTGSVLKFNIDVSQSANNKATFYTSTVFSTVIDGSALENFGLFRFWLGLHSLTSAQLSLISSIDFIFGSDASATPATKANYWTINTTTPVDGGNFQKTFNRMNFDWANAVKTGSPDSANLKYFEITINFSASMTDCNNIRIDELAMYEPVEMELIYFSSNFVSKGGTWQEHFTTSTIDTTEQLLLPSQHLDLFVNLALTKLAPQKEKNNNDYIRAKTESQQQLSLAIQQDGNPITRAKNEFQVAGSSTGRSDYKTQW